ncbi:MAG: hypothetical protein E7230_04550 [Clostridiales bacterium]|nr:hypothetical protein [Clostridiales bacterium]
METNRKGLLNRKWVVAILAYIGLIALCCIVVYGIPSVRGMLERTYIAEHGSIDVTEEVSGFIVRDEVVYAADQKSKISRVIEPGTLVKAGTRVVELTPTEKEEEPEEETTGDETAENGTAEEKPAEGTETGTAETEEAAEEEPEENTAGKTGKYANAMEELGDTVVFTADGSTKDSGYISYTIDGAEARLTKAAIDGLTEKDLKDLTSRKTLKLPDKKCGDGYPVFKIVRNSKWYLVFFVDNESAYRYIEGDTLTIDINGEPVSVRVAKVDSGTKTSKIVLSCKAFYDGFFDTRTLDTTVTFVSSEGLVIEDDSIVEAPDGKRGVFVKNKLGEHVFTPIRVKADNGKKCVVFEDIYVDADGNFVETISTYDEIIAVPSEEDIASLEETNPAKKGGTDDKADGN